MYIENIIRDIRDIIYDSKRVGGNVCQSKAEAFRDDDLSEALWGLDQAVDGLDLIEHRLERLIDMIEMETLSAKVQSK